MLARLLPTICIPMHLYHGLNAHSMPCAHLPISVAPHPAQLQDANAAGTKIIAAGGSIMAASIGKPCKRLDLDLFPIGSTAKEASTTAEHIKDATIDNLAVQSSTITANSTSMYVSEPHNTGRPMVIQVVHRSSPSVGGVLRTFDLSSCQIAWDGRRLLCTNLHAYERDTGESKPSIQQLLHALCK